MLLSDALDLFDYGGEVWLVFPNGDAELAESIADIYRCDGRGGKCYADREQYEQQFGETTDGW